MTRPIGIALALLLTIAQPLTAQTRRPVRAPVAADHVLLGVQAGYNSGRALDVTITPLHLFGRSPLQARFGLRYASVDPGDAMAARHAFINDNTDGTPQQHGLTLGLKLDLRYPVRLLSLSNAHAFVGVRHAWFTGDYRFVGANEDFEVSSNHWGFGGGLETEYPLGPRLGLSLTAGVDYFLPSRMYGHDTAYSPNGTGENPRAGFSYADADRAVGQPKLAPIMMVGMQYRF